MNKREFLAALEEGLLSLPQEERTEHLAFYEEMIDDGMEEGLSETQAVAAIGSVEQIVAHILSENPSVNLSVTCKKRLSPWAIVLLVLGSPLWLSLLLAAFAVVVALVAVLWAVVVSLWAVGASLAGCAVGGVVCGIGYAVNESLPMGMALIGAGLFCAGLSVLAFPGCRAATKGAVWLTKFAAVGWRKKEASV